MRQILIINLTFEKKVYTLWAFYFLYKHLCKLLLDSITFVADYDGACSKNSSLSLECGRSWIFGLSRIFGELYDFFSDEVDEFAERIRALNAYPVATYAKMLEISHFKEEETIPSSKMVAVLLQDIETMANEIRSWIPDEDDAITQDMYVGLVTTLDKKVWMLRAMTQPGVQ